MQRVLSRVAGIILVCLSGCQSEFAADDAQMRIVFQVNVDETTGDRDAVSESVRQTIETRLRAAEIVPDFIVQSAADDRIEVLTPDISEQQIEQIRNLATRAGTLEFALLANQNDHTTEIDHARMASESPDGAWAWIPVAGGVDDPGSHELVVIRYIEPADPSQREYLVILGPAEQRITGDGLQWARAGADSQGNACLEFQLSEQNGRRMIAVTAAASPAPSGLKRRLAIILDGEIHSAPSIMESIGGRGQITGQFNEEELRQLGLVLSAGQLAAPVEFVESEIVESAGE